MAETWGESPIHTIIARPHEYEIVRMEYCCDPQAWENTYLDLWLRRATTTRRLRFLRPQELQVNKGPLTTNGMMILDIRHRQWDDVRIEVADFESSEGGMTFFAADVVDLDATEQSDVR